MIVDTPFSLQLNLNGCNRAFGYRFYNLGVTRFQALAVNCLHVLRKSHRFAECYLVDRLVAMLAFSCQAHPIHSNYFLLNLFSA